ncbi:DUF3349 domain-containing protein [Mycobacterium sp. HUMS_1102779]|uniref:DUF3349 domain-containing protein n=1 Tax=Mycobacterium sp. HUMS_1102779 TaxID=3383487 RepID=UPI003899C322
MANVVSRVVGFLRAGYPAGVPATGYVPLFALLPRRVSDDEIVAITERIRVRGVPVGAADMGVEISRVTDEMPSLDDIDRVHDRLAALGWPAGQGA